MFKLCSHPQRDSIVFNYTVRPHVVWKVDNAYIRRINHHPEDSVVCFVNTYPLDSDLFQWTVLSSLWTTTAGYKSLHASLCVSLDKKRSLEILKGRAQTENMTASFKVGLKFEFILFDSMQQLDKFFWCVQVYIQQNQKRDNLWCWQTWSCFAMLIVKAISFFILSLVFLLLLICLSL